MPARFLALFLVFVVSTVAFAQDPTRDATIVKTLLRLPNYDVNAKPTVKEAVLRHMATHQGTERYVELAEHFKLTETAGDLRDIAIANPADSLGVRAATLLLTLDEGASISAVIAGEDETKAVAAVQALGNVGNAKAVELLQPLVTDETLAGAIRTTAVTAMRGNRNAEKHLLQLKLDGKLSKQLEFVTADALLSSADPAIREEAAKHFERRATGGGTPLPPLSELIAKRGDAGAGKELFNTKGTCIKCHKIHGEGKEVGPDLSEIGSKLSREAMFVSILDPSAGISHNYETHGVILDSGKILNGIIISETDDAITIKDAEAITRTISRDEIEEMMKQPISLMPADLQKNLTVDELVNIVDYLQTLRKKQ